jgi:predicted lactoylglutathione lyase
MYRWGFYDADGHHWEALHMDMSAAAFAAAN